ncbi:hypothetical protein T440DRAFT_522522 [Plenodomus tracheiphilus IPT5]|uniref:Protein kinase domain-containing protein n=1 Tax=Plenodomus tracheiphilus IPT5 TaxID=1408161 RepID=A0A6A7ATS9_9PLEO|nr:hypothetical protein T440DRAFT_522522 [Plenodomus tracheiphilus IPT5]
MAQSQPPFKTYHRYFDSSAREWMKTNRPAWTGAQRTSTINDIWHARPRVQEYFEGARGTNPGPDLPDWLVIPDAPYTRTQATAAKNHGTFPGLEEDMESTPPSVSEHSPPNSPRAEYGAPQSEREIPETPSEIPETQSDEPIRTLSTVPVATSPRTPTILEPDAAPDARPYSFWPQPPWNDSELYTSIGLQSQKDFKRGWVYGRWYTVRQLKRSDRESAFLHVRTNATNNIIDRMVIRQRRFSPREWRDPQQWRDRRPREIRIHEIVEERRRAQPKICRQSHAGGLPEAIIWHIVRALARACLTLQTGSYEEHDTVPGWRPITHLGLQPHNVFLGFERQRDEDEDHEEVTPTKRARSNMVMTGKSRKEMERTENAHDDESAELQCMTVVPVLRNFRLSFYNVCEDKDLLRDNPEDYMLNIEDTRYAPEHQGQYPNESPILLDERADVWGIGNIAAHLICNEMLEHGPVREDEFLPVDPNKPPEENTERRRCRPVGKRKRHEAFQPSRGSVFTGRFFPDSSSYSRALLNMVRQCLSYEKEQRYGLRQSLDLVDREFDRSPQTTHLHAHDMEELVAASQSSDHQRLFAIGQRLGD